MHFITKVQRTNKSRFITLPKLLCEYVGLNFGDTVLLMDNPDKTITILGNDELNKRLASKQINTEEPTHGRSTQG